MGFGENVLKSYKAKDDQQKVLDLEADRKLKLEQLQQNIAITGNQEQRNQVTANQKNTLFDQSQQELSKQQGRQEDKNQALYDMMANIEKQNNKTNVNALDTIMMNTFKTNDYTELNRVLTDSTENNVHSMVKTELEKSLGGRVLKIEPNPDKGEDDDTESKIQIQLPNGEVQEHLFDLDGFTQRLGTPVRVGVSAYTDTLMKASTNVTTGEVNLKDLFQKALIGSKNGDSSSKAIVKGLSDYMSMDNKTGRKIPITLEDAQQAFLDAVEEGDGKGAELAIEQYERLMRFQKLQTSVKANKTVRPLTFDQQRKLEEEDKFNNLQSELTNLSPDDITEGNVNDITNKVTNYVTAGKPSEKVMSVRRSQLANALFNNDKSDVLNMQSQELLSGIVNKDTERSLKVLKQLQGTEKANKTQSEYLASMDAHGKVVRFSNKLRADWKELQKNIGTTYANLGTSVYDKSVKSVGQLLGDTKWGAGGLDITSLATEADDLYNVLKDPKATKSQKDIAKRTIASKFRMGANTEGFLIMKDMLKLLSGAGVTNEELERYSSSFIGTDYTDMEGVIQNLTSSAKKSMESFNIDFSNSVSAGSYYSAYAKALSLRKDSQELRSTWGDDVYTTGLGSVKLSDPTLQTNDAGAFFKKINDPRTEKFIKSFVNGAYNYRLNNGGKIEGYDFTKENKLFSNADPKTQQLYKEALVAYKDATKNAQAMEKAPAKPKGTQPQAGYITEPPSKEDLASVGIRYNKQDNDILKYVYGLENGGATDASVYNLQNPNSTAYGKGQFLMSDKGVAKGILDKLGKTYEDYKTDPLVQEQVMYVNYNMIKSDLKALGQPASKFNVYTVHQLGQPRAKRFFNKTLTSKDIRVMQDNLGDKYRDKPLLAKGEVIKMWNNKYRGGRKI